MFADPIVALSDAVRPVMLIGFVVLLFAGAGLAVVVGRRLASRKDALALSADAGMDKGAFRGSDSTHSGDWLTETRNEEEDATRQNWTDLLLGAGHHNDSPEISDAPTGQAPEADPWGSLPDWEATPTAPTAPTQPFLVDSGLDEDA